MSALIRQQFIDPLDGIFKIKDMQLEVDLVRPDNSLQVEPIVTLRLDPAVNHNQKKNDFNTVTVDPCESLSVLLDGKRTSPPLYCLRSRLIKQSHNFFTVDNISHLKLRVGDPIVVLSSLDESSTKKYAIVKSINENTIEIWEAGDDVVFHKGSIVQNLANRWHKEHGIVGAKSQLKAPAPTTFVAKRKPEMITVAISPPLNLGTIKYYDIFVRSTPFSKLPLHWVADYEDVEAHTTQVNISTYNGGPESGGGMIKDYDSRLYVAVVSKDTAGNFDVNESTPKCQLVEVST